MNLNSKSHSSRTLLPTSFASEIRGLDAQPFDLILAKINANVYEPSGQPIGDWSPLKDDEARKAGIDPSLFHDDRTGFRARIYSDSKGHYVLVFCGTNETRDWLHNIRQGVGFEDAQYDHAVRLSLQAHKSFGDNLVLTGHSLGGGLALVGSLATNSPAVTFNAAGLHRNTIEHLGFDAEAVRSEFARNGQVRRYAIDNEILTGLQERNLLTRAFLPDALGHKIELPDPDPVRGWKKLIPGSSLEHGIEIHGMDAVIDAQRLASRGSIDNAAHPSNGMFNDALAGLKGIKADTLGFHGEVEYRNAAGALVGRAHQAGMQRIDHVVVGANGALFAVEGPLDDACHRIASVDKAQASAQPIEVSSRQVQARPEAAESQAQQVETQRRIALTP